MAALERKKILSLSPTTKFSCTSVKDVPLLSVIAEESISGNGERVFVAYGVPFKSEPKPKAPRRWIRDSDTRKQIIQPCHHVLACDHFDRDKTKRKNSAGHYWQGLYVAEDVQRWVYEPLLCFRYKEPLLLADEEVSSLQHTASTRLRLVTTFRP